MAKQAQKTKVIINGSDVSNYVIAVDLHRESSNVETASVTFCTSRLEVEDSGTLVVRIDTEE